MLSYVYRSPNIVRVIKSRRWRRAGHVARMLESRNAFIILTDKSTGRPRRRWEDNIRMDLEERGIRVDSAQDRNYCECGIEPTGSIIHGVS